MFLIDIWKEKSAPYVQLAYFMYDLGGVVTPLFAEPFIKSTSLSNKFNSTAITSKRCIVSLAKDLLLRIEIVMLDILFMEKR